jgi:hypothetical protein
MSSDLILYTVYKAANGYYARTHNDAVVVGATLSEVATAAQAAVAEAELLRDELDEPKEMKVGAWEKVR